MSNQVFRDTFKKPYTVLGLAYFEWMFIASSQGSVRADTNGQIWFCAEVRKVMMYISNPSEIKFIIWANFLARILEYSMLKTQYRGHPCLKYARNFLTELHEKRNFFAK